jgi:clan AA aspartic protease (TIGR02281 family)
LLIAVGGLVLAAFPSASAEPAEEELSPASSGPAAPVQESELILSDRQALRDARATGISSKIMAAKVQLSDDLLREAQERRKDASGIAIPLISDNEGHFFVNVLINDHIPASLIVDTGAPTVLLSSRFVRALGVDPGRAPTGTVTALNGKHRAAQVRLRSIKLGRAWKQNIDATVLLEKDSEVEDRFRDGLLGLSFLNKYHFTLDQKNRRLILRKVE